MAKTIAHYKVFLASPSDVPEERDAVKVVLEELNLSMGKFNNIHLELVRWETHAYPSVGIDGQDVINSQIDDDYDIFIGIMWSRFGTPTGRAGSGTQEEFERAYKRYKDKDDVKILFYFSSKPISPMDVDLGQLQLVQTFRKDIEQKGALYFAYNGIEEFQKLVRIHLQNQLHDIVNQEKKTIEKIPSVEIMIQDDQEIANDELGYFEYMELGLESFKEVENASIRTADYLEELGLKMTHRAEKLTGFGSLTHSNQKEIKRVIDRAADDMMGYVEKTNIEIPIFNESIDKGLNAMNSAIELWLEGGNRNTEELKSVCENIIELKDVITNNQANIKSFKVVIKSLPPATQKFIRAKAKMDDNLKRLLKEFSTLINLLYEFEKSINNHIDRLSDNQEEE